MTDEEAQRIKDALVVSFFREWIELAAKRKALRDLEAILVKMIAAGPPPPEQPDDWRPPWLSGANTEQRDEP